MKPVRPQEGLEGTTTLDQVHRGSQDLAVVEDVDGEWPQAEHEGEKDQAAKEQGGDGNGDVAPRWLPRLLDGVRGLSAQTEGDHEQQHHDEMGSRREEPRRIRAKGEHREADHRQEARDDAAGPRPEHERARHPGQERRHDRRVLHVLAVAQEIGEARGIPVGGHEGSRRRPERHGDAEGYDDLLHSRSDSERARATGPGTPATSGQGRRWWTSAQAATSSRPPVARIHPAPAGPCVR